MSPLDKLHALHDDLVRRNMYATARDVNKIIVELRKELPETGVRAAWAAVVDALCEARPDWDETAGKSSMENAVATIRSMAAQCSAQPAPDYVRPMGVPAIRREQIDALVFANGFMYAKGHEPIADQLAALVGWLRTNAPQE